MERIEGDEQAFVRDLETVDQQERRTTLAIQRAARVETLRLIDGASDEQVDRVDTRRRLPGWASWTTARRMAWHIADTESRYYLPNLGLPARQPLPDLEAELRASAEHVIRTVETLPATPLAVHEGGELWSPVKLLRRLAWHERRELVVLRRLLDSRC